MADMDAGKLVDFIDFLNEACTGYHAVEAARQRLLKAGFKELQEEEPFSGAVKAEGKYFYTRNMTALIAFTVGGGYKKGNGFVITGAHTDSPCPKLKPVSKSGKGGFVQVATQPYGGGLWHTWFDRDLTVAGRAIVKREGGFSQELVRVDRPILRISTLAIHLTSAEERKAFAPNLHSNCYPVLATEAKALLDKPVPAAGAGAGAQAGSGEDEKKEKHHALLLKVLSDELSCAPEDIQDFELQLCDTQPSAIGGACSEFVMSGRLDNLCSSWQATTALIDSCDSLAEEPNVRMVALFDHEEVGSTSAHGAGSSLIPEALRRIAKALVLESEAGVDEDSTAAVMRNSFLISADMAHAAHPNYLDKHDPALSPKMHAGMVIKHNANQRYATNSVTAFLFRECGARAGLPSQEFAVRSDMGCGSTIGPMLSCLSGIRTVDVGSPQLSMHSIREVMATDDAIYGYKHIKACFEHFAQLDAELSKGKL